MLLHLLTTSQLLLWGAGLGNSSLAIKGILKPVPNTRQLPTCKDFCFSIVSSVNVLYSSNIGDGLAASAYEFSEEKENEDRTKIIIFSTDNQLAGTPIFTLEEAASICKEKNIVVFGIGTEFIGTNEASSMKVAMEETGGKLYIDQSKESLNQIVENIESTSKSLLKDETEIRKVGIVKVPFILLVIAVSTMLILLKVTKR